MPSFREKTREFQQNRETGVLTKPLQLDDDQIVPRQKESVSVRSCKSDTKQDGKGTLLLVGGTLAFRIIRGCFRRLIRRVRIIVLTASGQGSDLVSPQGFRFARTSAGTPEAADYGLVEEAMRAAEEPDGLVASRLAHGDEFFGWLAGGRIVSFGWVTYRDRKIGSTQLAETPERVFLFNFYTLKEYRGQGLYPALLLAIRAVLGREQMNEFVISVLDHNLASLRGIEKAGFLPVAQVSYFLLFDHWCCGEKRTLLAAAAQSLFAGNRTSR